MRNRGIEGWWGGGGKGAIVCIVGLQDNYNRCGSPTSGLNWAVEDTQHGSEYPGIHYLLHKYS